MNQYMRNAIYSFADAIREFYSISGPINNIEEIVHIMGGRIELYDTADFFAAGSIRKENDSFVICLPKGEPENRKNFTIAHELGHLFLHMGYKQKDTRLWDSQDGKEYFRQDNAEEETQANEFAGAFLMPQKEYFSILHKFADDNIVDTTRVASYFHVSAEAAAIRGKWLGYLAW